MIKVFSTRGCSHCLALKMTLTSNNIQFSSCCLDDEPEAMDKFNITSVPTIIKFDATGNEISRLKVFSQPTKEILAFCND